MSSNSVVQISDPVQSAVEYMKHNLGFRCGSILGKGTYGSVVKVTSRESDQYAAKVIERKVLNDMELLLWPKLKHENILRLVDTVCALEDVVIFLTDLMATNLFLRLQSRDFKDDPKATERCRTYARQVLAGISYLHSHKLCHLDLRSENVFLAAEDDRAVVADFSGLSWSDIERKFCPLPHSLRPPEMLTSKKRVSPIPIDLWACGLLLANLFLGKGFYIITVKNSRAGHIDAVQQYTGTFQCEVYVMKFINETYKNSSLTYSSMKSFINIVSRFLHMNPKSRMKVDEALSHPFLTCQSIRQTVAVEDLDKVKTELSLTLQQLKDESLQNRDGVSEEFQVNFSKKSTGKAESSMTNKSFRVKRVKTSTWSRYKRWWTDIGKLPFTSAPLFKYIKFKRKPARKRPKKKEMTDDQKLKPEEL